MLQTGMITATIEAFFGAQAAMLRIAHDLTMHSRRPEHICLPVHYQFMPPDRSCQWQRVQVDESVPTANGTTAAAAAEDAVKGLPSLGPKPKGGAPKKEATATATA
jgi:hypothetical protein